MTVEQQRTLAQPIVDLYENLTDELMTLIAEQFASYQGLTETGKWRAAKLAQSGNFNQKAIKTIAKRTRICPELIAAAIEQAARQACDEVEPQLQEAARQGVVSDASVSADSTVMQAFAMYQKQAQDACNLVNTVMLYKARDAYTGLVDKVANLAERPEFLQILGKSTGAVVTGMQSRQAAVRQCIREFSEKGLPGFVDRAGREWSPEAYINMDIRTTVNNVAHETQFSRMDAYGSDIIEVSSHAGARPLCAPYQGRLYSRSGKTIYTRDVQGRELAVSSWASTSYGQAAGLLGINCGHQIYPFFPGLSSRTYKPYPAAENAENYKLSQKQRYYERQVRASKRECMMLDKLGDKEGFSQASIRLKERRTKLNSFLEETGRTARNDRTQVVGFNRSVNRKATAAAQKKAVASSGRSGIIKTDRNFRDVDDMLVDITQESIDAVPLVEIPGWSASMNEDLQAAHKRLLKEAMSAETGTEFASVHRMDMSQVGEIIHNPAVDKSVHIPDQSFNYIALHNHPSGTVFSHTDIYNFIKRDRCKGLTAIGNDGSVYVMIKSKEYDAENAMEILLGHCSEIQGCKNDRNISGYIGEMYSILKGDESCGNAFIEG